MPQRTPMPHDRLQRKSGSGGPAASETASASSRPFSLPPGYRRYYGLDAPSAQPPQGGGLVQRRAGAGAPAAPANQAAGAGPAPSDAIGTFQTAAAGATGE